MTEANPEKVPTAEHVALKLRCCTVRFHPSHPTAKQKFSHIFIHRDCAFNTPSAEMKFIALVAVSLTTLLSSSVSGFVQNKKRLRNRSGKRLIICTIGPLDPLVSFYLTNSKTQYNGIASGAPCPDTMSLNHVNRPHPPPLRKYPLHRPCRTLHPTISAFRSIRTPLVFTPSRPRILCKPRTSKNMLLATPRTDLAL